ncbi:hypothetical protein HPT25_06760 [Bacillus sp. BRMEA1]|uniref:GNAT family N-acetyltransferase n=1 Tax=Neobacillus endophyticus TaxID=2738405 RepID=UPI00156709FA|nr:hypothetical protein [Neobacillus endophyticus]NRD77197.1 hypothetical protein [Neobacillus endophyticus]
MPGIIRKAMKEDLSILEEFLIRANLGTSGISDEDACSFLLLENESGVLEGTLGMETIAEYGFLRSLVVKPGQVEKEIIVLFEQMVKLAKSKGMRSLFLATNKIVTLPFFNMLGFEKVEREELPKEFYQSEHIRHVLNVDNSLFLKFSL